MHSPRKIIFQWLRSLVLLEAQIIHYSFTLRSRIGPQSFSFHHTTNQFDTEGKSGRTKGSSQKIWFILSFPWLRGVVRTSKCLQYDIWFIRFLGVEQNKMVDPHLAPTASLWQPHPQPVLGWVMDNGLISSQHGVFFFSFWPFRVVPVCLGWGEIS